MTEPPHPTQLDRPIRQAARVLLLDRDGRVLMFRFVDPVSGSPFWITPGGGLDEGESFEDAARRELREETGLVEGEGLVSHGDTRIGPCVWTRTIDIRYGHKHFRQHERYFPLRLTESQPAIDTAGMMDYEVTDLHEHRWWSAAEIAASDHRFAPSKLSTLLPELLGNPWPSKPLDVGR
ncbi:NUDIX hydrolase [Algisphaera agarilytica]|uniref:8-oxo-dGTP pyrophosphatase MutT (NUDIX family) n=1 Tax=Algisphaera agarilytica TaxID=1385975 RepID=A0A7X0H7P8_9BACT|nr:NUDIX domain-containing protein [Algisphaera agarilytica]MBB6430820.1 8-oxo-dGTP pyrophosphatase MutT (NUDIX family) [Algisphaera agarilytica]